MGLENVPRTYRKNALPKTENVNPLITSHIWVFLETKGYRRTRERFREKRSSNSKYRDSNTLLENGVRFLGALSNDI